ncbi:MAG TPA: porin [Solimonas sp.]|nr:porin [Solimonas sp.]
MTYRIPAGRAALCALPMLLAAQSATAADELLETLAQKGVITMEEYEKLKAARKATPSVSTDDGFRVVSGDGAASAQVGTLQQLDFAAYQDETGYDLPDGSEMRRSRLSVGGTFLKDWSYRAEYEFAGTTGVTDAYVAYNGYKPLVITAGNFKVPFGMDALAADKSVAFMERALSWGFVPSRAPGLMVSSSGSNWSAALGVFGEPVGSTQAGDESYGGVGRVSWAPMLAENRVLHVGAAVQVRNPTQNIPGPTAIFAFKPESNQVPNTQRLLSLTSAAIGALDLVSVGGLELAWQQGPFSAQAEYTHVQLDRKLGAGLDFSGGYAQLAWTLSGEGRRYKIDKGIFEGVRPAANFAKDGGWGALELAARYSTVDLEDRAVDGGQEDNAALALNWYLNPFVRVSFNAIKVLEVDGGPFPGKEPTIYQMRLQLAI